MAKITVLVPVYNEQACLRRCVDSVLAQSFRDWELILVDDGSTDDSPAICDAYAAADGRIRVIHQANKGFSGARNTGLKAVRGEYLIMADADDYLEPNALSVGVERMDKYHLDLVIGGFYWTIFRDETILSQTPVVCEEDYFFRTVDMPTAAPYMWNVSPFAGPFHYCVWSRVYRTSVIRDFDIRFDENLFVQEDVKFMYTYFLYADRCMLSKELFYHYCRPWDKNDIAEKPQINQYQCVEESLVVVIKAGVKFNYPKRYQQKIYQRTYDHFIKLSEKIFLPSTGLSQAQQLHHIRCMADGFAFRFFCRVFAATDPFWRSLAEAVAAGDYQAIFHQWRDKLSEGVAPAGE